MQGAGAHVFTGNAVTVLALHGDVDIFFVFSELLRVAFGAPLFTGVRRLATLLFGDGGGAVVAEVAEGFGLQRGFYDKA
jgi:hypothetical protein